MGLKKKLINLRNDLGLFKEIKFLGKIEPNQINKFLKNLIFILIRQILKVSQIVWWKHLVIIFM